MLDILGFPVDHIGCIVTNHDFLVRVITVTSDKLVEFIYNSACLRQGLIVLDAVSPLLFARANTVI